MLNTLNKYDYIDNVISIPVRTGDLTPVTDFTTLPVTNLQVVPNVSWNGITNITKLQVTWDGHATVGSSETYKLVWYNDSGVVHEARDLITPSYDILNPIAGNYTIAVRAINSITNIATASVKTIYNYKLDGLSTLLPPVNPSVVGSTTLTVISDRIKLTWDYNTSNTTVTDKLIGYLVEVYDEIPAGVINSYNGVVLANLNGTITIPYTEIFAIFGTYPRKITFKIFSKDTFGFTSTSGLTFTIENPVPAVQNFTLVALEKAIQIIVETSTDKDGLGYNIYTSLTSGGLRTLMYSGTERFITIPQIESIPILKYVTIDAFDLLGTVGLLTSPEQSITALATSSGSSTNLTRDFINIGETFNIPTGYQLLVAEELFNSGEIINNNLVYII
jgi:hypothetical protein